MEKKTNDFKEEIRDYGFFIEKNCYNRNKHYLVFDFF